MKPKQFEGAARSRMQKANSSTSRPSEPALDRHIQSRIGDRLRAMYDNLAEQPVPDRFASLLEKLDLPEKGNA